MPGPTRRVTQAKAGPLTYGGVRAMWVIAMFDLPVDTKEARKRYARFRKSLVNDGFLMLQLSVYGRPCPSEESALVHTARVKKAIPSEGQVRILRLTDMQFSRMEVFYGKTAVPAESGPDQLSLF